MCRRSFSKEFNVETVRLVRDRGVSLAQASRDLDVHENVIRKWVKDFKADPLEAFPGQGRMKPEQAEIERLRREVQKLKTERGILKKAAAYFAKDQTGCLRSWPSTGGFGRSRLAAGLSVSRVLVFIAGSTGRQARKQSGTMCWPEQSVRAFWRVSRRTARAASGTILWRPESHADCTRSSGS